MFRCLSSYEIHFGVPDKTSFCERIVCKDSDSPTCDKSCEFGVFKLLSLVLEGVSMQHEAIQVE